MCYFLIFQFYCSLYTHVKLTFCTDFLVVPEYTLHLYTFVVWLTSLPLLVPLFTMFSDGEILSRLELETSTMKTS